MTPQTFAAMVAGWRTFAESKFNFGHVDFGLERRAIEAAWRDRAKHDADEAAAMEAKLRGLVADLRCNREGVIAEQLANGNLDKQSWVPLSEQAEWELRFIIEPLEQILGAEGSGK